MWYKKVIIKNNRGVVVLSAIKEIFEDKSTGDKPAGVAMQVCWYGERIGTACMTENGLSWKGFASEQMEDLFGKRLPIREEDGMPQFLVNLEPEHEVFAQMGINDKNDYLSTGLRFLSNFTISRNAPFDMPVNHDELQADFSAFIDDNHIFTGSYISELPSSFDEDELSAELSDLWSNRYAPRYSGQETKIPVSLNEDGTLEEAITKPFTHFLKLPNDGPKEGWGLNEWMCMQLAEASGIETAQHALITLSDSLAPAYMVERFDIESKHHDHTVIPLMQDLCTIDGMRPLKGLEAQIEKEGLAIGSIEKIAPVIAELSTDPKADMENFFQRTLISYAVGDGDMHRKNVSMIFKYDTKSNELVSARMSPAYDITSEVHTAVADIGMALRINGKPKNFKKKDFIACAARMGIEAERAEEIMESTFTKIADRAVEIANNLPENVRDNIMCNYTANRIATIAVKRAKLMGYETPEWKEVRRVKNSDSGLSNRLGGGREAKINMDAFKIG
jgi:hypothetical protein